MLPGTTFYFVHLNAVCIHDYRVSSQSLRSEREGSHVSAPWTGTWQLRSLTWRGHCWKITLVKTGKRLYPLWSSHIAPEQTARYHSISHSTCRYAVSTKVKLVRYTGGPVTATHQLTQGICCLSCPILLWNLQLAASLMTGHRTSS